MESEGFQKQMFSTIRKGTKDYIEEKIFNVRKVAYKQFDNEKYLKSNFSPFQKKQVPVLPSTIQPSKKNNQYNYQLAIISSNAYKDLNKKYQRLKEQHAAERQKRIQVKMCDNFLKKLQEKEQELDKYRVERERLEKEKDKLNRKKDELKTRIQQIRERNQELRAEHLQRSEEYRIMNMEYLRNMIMGMHFQNGIQIDPDNMTYEELLQLEEKMGSVSKGMTLDQLNKLAKVQMKEATDDVCSICYYNVKGGQWINRLPCNHIFHCDCIKDWLLKQRVCPMCKQEIILDIAKSKVEIGESA